MSNINRASLSIENNIFDRYIPDFAKLKKYGFKLNGGIYYIVKKLKNSQFAAIIEISQKGTISGKVYDSETNEEYLPLRFPNQQGVFVGEIRLQYEKILLDIRNNCFSRTYFVFPQANRIALKIVEKYGDEPEFLWEKFKGCGVFREKNSKKWYAAILSCAGKNFSQEKEETVEIIDIKLSPENIENLLKQKEFYPAYHMNKKHWITIILDESLQDDVIMKLVEESHALIIG